MGIKCKKDVQDVPYPDNPYDIAQCANISDAICMSSMFSSFL